MIYQVYWVYSILTSSSAYVCNPVCTVNKRLSAVYNTISFADSPDMTATCPSDEMMKGVYNSGCPATYTHNTPGWWHCHINNNAIYVQIELLWMKSNVYLFVFVRSFSTKINYVNTYFLYNTSVSMKTTVLLYINQHGNSLCEL